MATVNDKSDPLVQAAVELFGEDHVQIVRISGAERLKNLLDMLEEDLGKLHRNVEADTLSMAEANDAYYRAMDVIRELRTFKV